jgi:hypothetical protein
MQAPRQPHLDAVLRILRYVKYGPSQGIFFPSSSKFHIKAFVTMTGLDVQTLDVQLQVFVRSWVIL